MKVSISRKFYRDSVTMEHTSDDLTLDQLVEILIRPALLAMGYQPESISSVIGEPNDAASLVTENDDEI